VSGPRRSQAAPEVTALTPADEDRVLLFSTWRGAELRIEVLADGTLWLETPGYFLTGTNKSISCVPGERGRSRPTTSPKRRSRRPRPPGRVPPGSS
jgi:hypothetical protein